MSLAAASQMPTLGPSVKTLRLNSNGLSFAFSPNDHCKPAQSSQLVQLELQGNHISGDTNSMFKCLSAHYPALSILDVSNNELTLGVAECGTSAGLLPRLVALNVSNNWLEGPFDSLFNLLSQTVGIDFAGMGTICWCVCSCVFAVSRVTQGLWQHDAASARHFRQLVSAGRVLQSLSVLPCR